MSRIHLTSNTLLFWLSLTAAACTASVFVGCSSSDSGGTAEAGGASAGKGGKASTAAGAPASEAGDSSVGGTDPGTGGDDEPSSGGTLAVGGAEPTGDAGQPGEAGAAGAPAGDDETAAAIQRASDLIDGLTPVARKCPTCHQANYAGLGYWKNLTPDPTTGIGGEAWTDDKIKRAIHEGLDEQGDALCSQMEHYQFTDAQLDDLVVFLRSQKPVSNTITLACPN